MSETVIVLRDILLRMRIKRVILFKVSHHKSDVSQMANFDEFEDFSSPFEEAKQAINFSFYRLTMALKTE